jgi:NAD+ kinase
MKRVQLYVNNTKTDAYLVANNIKTALIENGYTVTDNNPDLIIGFGGDGTLLHLLHSTNFNMSAKYIGVNCGTLGFMQDFDITNASEFVKNIPLYIEKKLHFVSMNLYVKEKVFSYHALNEFYLLNDDNTSFKVKVEINDEFLEKFVGTGIIFSTPTGSTAHNISSGGPILYPGIEAIIMTPSETFINSKQRCLSKSICIPKEIKINLTPFNSNEIKVLSDGKKIYTGNFDKIIISYSPLYMIKLTSRLDNFTTKIREKLI